MNRLVIIGASGHGKVVADIAEKNGYTSIIFLDDNQNVKSCGVYSVVGGCNEAASYRDSDFIVAIGNSKIRQKIQFELCNKGLNVVSLIHPSATVASHVEIGEGTVVMAGAVINPFTKIGKGCIVNTCASVDHDCIVSDYAHISVGAHVAGTVTIGEGTWIGAGATVINNTNVCSDCMIGAGAVVVKSIEKSGIYIGVPAKEKI